ncbi:MAG: prefoldin subunit alpha [Promethearchaeota archaeon]
MSQAPDGKDQLSRQLIITVQTLEEEMSRGQSNLQMIDIQSQRLAETAVAVKSLKDHKPGDELMISIGSGVHIHVKMASTSHIVKVLGAGFAAEKTLDDALKGIEEQQKQLAALSQRQQEQLRTTQARLEEAQSQLSQLLRPSG